MGNAPDKFLLRLPSLWTMSITLDASKQLDIREKWSLAIHSQDQRYSAIVDLSLNNDKWTGDWLDAIENEAFLFSVHSSSGKHLRLVSRKIGASELIEGRISLHWPKER